MKLSNRNTGVTAIALLFAAFLFSAKSTAQDLEPRRWGHLPSGLNMIGVGYLYSDAFVYFSPFLKITDTNARINSYAVSAIHTFDLAGKSARVGFLLPFVSGRWEGDVDNQYEVVHRNGFADPRLRISVNLYGAPALKGEEYVQYRVGHMTNTVVGVSVAVTVPLGQYYDDELINIGGNRWVVRPQIGVVHSRGPWSFELTGSAYLFTDNKNFIDNTRIEQKAMYAVQAHIIYDFKPGLWVSVSTGYGVGGRAYLDDVKTAFEVDNWLGAASFGFPIGKRQSAKLTWLSGRTQNDVGRDSDNLLLSWSMRW
jgi:hypothetical protein